MARSKTPWMRLSADAWALGAESAAARRMMALTGAPGFTAHGAAKKSLKHYRRKVCANRRRLSAR